MQANLENTLSVQVKDMENNLYQNLTQGGGNPRNHNSKNINNNSGTRKGHTVGGYYGIPNCEK